MQKNVTRPRTNVGTLYGINAIKEALGARLLDYVLVAEGQHNPRVQEIIDTCRRLGIPLRFAPPAALERAAGTAQHQNVVAFCPAKSYEEVESLLHPEGDSLLVVLDGVQDPRNLGAVVRAAVGAGAYGLIIPERRSAGLSPVVAKAAAGALEHLKVARVKNLVRTLVDLKKANIWICGFESKAAKSYLEIDYTQPCALVFGGEGEGLHRLVREACDYLAHIPLRGPVESLNVSIAAAVVLYEAVRQRTPVQGQA